MAAYAALYFMAILLLSLGVLCLLPLTRTRPDPGGPKEDRWRGHLHDRSKLAAKVNWRTPE